MRKIILGLFIVFLTVSSINADDNKTMSDEEFMKQFMKLEQRQQEAKAKTKALEKLEKTVDKLTQKLGVDE